MQLEIGSWYWISDYREGDIFHPVFIVSEDVMTVDGKRMNIDENAGLTFTKAVMPDI